MMFDFLKKNTSSYKLSPTVLLILDGWGIAPPSEGNAIHLAKTPNMDNYIKMYPHTELIASGESVGLPANEVGNTEVGHLTLGAGRVVLQSVKKIATSIEEKTFHQNSAFISAINHAKKFNSSIHLMGLVGTGNVHSSIDHLYALLDTLNAQQATKVYLHLFTDGRDSPPNEAQNSVARIEEKLKAINLGQIATICGRYYAMDRDTRWERTKLAYDALVLGRGKPSASALEAINSAYKIGQTDEFIEPSIVMTGQGPVATINDNDSAIFFNFRLDRPRQLTMAFVLSDFENPKSFKISPIPDSSGGQREIEVKQTFKREKIIKNLFFATMTQYQKELPVQAVAFPPEIVTNNMPKILSDNSLGQMHIAESEKERFVTYYFRGLQDNAYPLEDTQIVKSPNVVTYDKKPEMSVDKIVSNFEKQLKKDKYHFFLINFANSDMVAHSGSISATVKAIEILDSAIQKLVANVLSRNGTIIITADHGNAEELLSFPGQTFFYTSSKGEQNTDHSNNPVPFIVISHKLTNNPVVLPKGSLSDVAPTVLELMGISKPPEMTGNSLLKGLVK